GAEVAMHVGAPVVGGHSVESKDLMYGLAAIGVVHPDHIFTNNALYPGDQLVLTKRLGTGGLTTAVKNNKLKVDDIQAAIDSMLLCNGAAVEPLRGAGVRAVTDITGFGLLGHVAELAVASDVQVIINQKDLPELPRAREMLARKQLTRGNKTNLAYAKSLGPVVGDPELLVRDAQTSGGLLAAVSAGKLDALVDALRAAGYPHATRIGEVREGRGVCLT
ncbi:MAG: selenide, water dikinase SelD, partial [Myxococcota bacterium]